MSEVQFTIFGNQENKLTGNPIPYTRTTQRGRWTPRSLRYESWKTYVVASYLDAVFPRDGSYDKAKFGELHDILSGKPIKREKAKVTIFIFFADETHADPDNVVKGINDALFQQDKHVDVETHHSCAHTEVPRVDVKIEFL